MRQDDLQKVQAERQADFVELDDEELAEVVGGLNPQPLPPGARSAFHVPGAGLDTFFNDSISTHSFQG